MQDGAFTKALHKLWAPGREGRRKTEKINPFRIKTFTTD